MNYTDLKTNIQVWAANDSINSYLTTIVELAEARINRTLRIRPMEKALSVALNADGTYAVPSDFIAIRDFYLFKHTGALPAGGAATLPYDLTNISNVVPLQVTSGENQFADFERTRTNRGRYRIAIIGGEFVVRPIPADSPNLGGMYYARFAALSAGNLTNWLTDNAPDLLLYAGLHQAAIFMKNEPQISYWEQKYNQTLEEVAAEHKTSRMSGSSLYPALRVG